MRGSVFRHWSPGLLRTQAFRIVLIYVFVFAVSATVLVGFTYWNTERSLDAQTDQIIEAEVTGLREQYQRLGLIALSDAINGRVAQHGSGLYLLVSPTGSVLAGNLTELPSSAKVTGRFVEFDYQRNQQGQDVTRTARGQAFFLAGGFVLLVARDVSERHLTRQLFTTTLPWSVGLMLLFGLVGGALLSRNMLTRLDAINRTSADIIAGDFSRRVPVTNAHDEFDALAENLNRMLERIERLMKGMRNVADSVAHDLRTPLNRLRNRLEEAQRRLGPQDPYMGDLEAAIAETDRLIATFNDLLLIAEADAGSARGSKARIELTTVVEDVTELYAPLAEEKNISLAAEPAGVVTIEGNRSLISQALANLVDNAIKYTPAGGQVGIVVAETPLGVDLTVADTGPGIPEEERERVLERFVRLESSRNSPGTGLGLSLVAAVARMHDARLSLGDNKPGLKATISFPRLPQRKNRSELREPPARP
ncbi:MAG: HAMP domain-containing protein [Alphaproteobacteria bacterium]|nr:HAMP domain-containing protein [Alphaproteobacteria bacterium]MDE2164127.1 HAMP domain-containing protein [Alphaproteobacteria bacterium]MDE2264888.1 HAMP domain-containing protein [Alphaproteobacteria bacterium]MDE2499307.1 HAMP domain-containing protein [Alphaproteobacteria bacterium]